MASMLMTLNQQKKTSTSNHILITKCRLNYHFFAVVHSVADRRPYYSQHPPNPLNLYKNDNTITVNVISTKSSQ